MASDAGIVRLSVSWPQRAGARRMWEAALVLGGSRAAAGTGDLPAR